MRADLLQPCRLCGASAHYVFENLILAKHQVRYYRCEACECLQTEAPYWLDEAYAHSISTLDTGIVQRNLDNFAVCYALAQTFKVKTAIDYGGGDGLLCRFLRDHLIDCHIDDRYGSAKYAQGYDRPTFKTPDMVTAFEVFEHLPNPSETLETLFALRPRVMVVTTELYAGEEADWYYLVPESGQHVFFYSAKALKLIADRFGYQIAKAGKVYLFVRQDEPRLGRQMTIAQSLLDGWVFQALKAYIFTLPAPGAELDFHKQLGRPAVGLSVPPSGR